MTSSSQAHRVDIDDAQPEDGSSHRHHHHRDPSSETDVELETPKNTNTKEGGRSGGGGGRAAFFGKVRSTSQRTKTKIIDRSEDTGAANDEKNMSKRLLSATSAALLRVKGVTIRSGSSGQVLHPRSVTVVRSLSPASSSRTRGGDEARASPRSSLQIASPPDRGRAKTSEEHSQERSISSCSVVTSARGSTPTSTEGVIRDGDRSKVSELYNDDDSGETTEGAKPKGSTIPTTNDDKGQAATPRSRWATTLMTSTLAREMATKATGKTTLGGGIGLLPRPQDAGDKVRYGLRTTISCVYVLLYESSPTVQSNSVRVLVRTKRIRFVHVQLLYSCSTVV